MGVLNVCILGGTGFVGRSIAARLSALGHRVCIPSRRPTRHRDLLVYPTVKLVEGDIHNAAWLRRRFEGMDAVINLVGILNQRRRRSDEFERVHARLPEKVVENCQRANVRRLLHMSALNAAGDAPSAYLRTKAAGEAAAHAAHALELAVTSFRPSVIFGPHDSFLNRFAGLLRFAPGVFPLACPDSRFQPVYVGDVARAFCAALTDHGTHGRAYDLCGPKVYTLKEIVTQLAALMGKRVKVVGLTDGLSRLQARLLEFAPGKPFTMDNYLSLTVDAVCPEGASALREDFGIEPSAMEQIAPQYIGPRAARGRYTPA